MFTHDVRNLIVNQEYDAKENAMTKDPNRASSEITVNVCKVCKTRYSLKEAKERNMTCCGEPLKEVEKEVPVPLGP